MIEKMSKVGLGRVIIGFESGNQRILNFLRKGTTVEQNFKAAQICKKYDLKITANYMLGIPTETEGEVTDTVHMIKKIKPDTCGPAYFTPYPGSELYNYCLENNLSLITSHDGYRRNPAEPKIRGIDYNFLAWAVKESMGTSLKSLVKQALRKMLGEKISEELLRHYRLTRYRFKQVKRKILDLMKE